MHTHSSSAGSVASVGGAYNYGLVQIGRPYMAAHNDLDAFVPRKAKFASPAKRDVILPFLKGVTTGVLPLDAQRSAIAKHITERDRKKMPKVYPSPPALIDSPPPRRHKGWTSTYSNHTHVLESLNLRGLR